MDADEHGFRGVFHPCASVFIRGSSCLFAACCDDALPFRHEKEKENRGWTRMNTDPELLKTTKNTKGHENRSFRGFRDFRGSLLSSPLPAPLPGRNGAVIVLPAAHAAG